MENSQTNAQRPYQHQQSSLPRQRESRSSTQSSSGKKKVGKYILSKKLGEGQFGGVYLALDTEDDNQPYAIKSIPIKRVQSNKLLMRLFKAEIEVMKLIKHPNLLHLYDFIESSSNYYIVTQFCEGGDLEKSLKAEGFFPEPKAVFLLKQIMSGFMELHTYKIMHRDFKVANIFLHNENVIIGDFGFAKAGVEMTTTRLGTPYNMAPEILLGDGNQPYTNLADLWSVGVVFYQMLFGRLPFPAKTLDKLKSRVQLFNGQNLVFPPGPKVSDQAKNLLKRMLQLDLNQRISWSELFRHPLFSDIKNSSYAPNVTRSSAMRGSRNTSRNINEQNLTSEEKRRQVEERFKLDKRKAVTSKMFVLPHPIDLKFGGNLGGEGNQFSRYSFGMGGGEASRVSLDLSDSNPFSNKATQSRNDAFFCHERNKHLLIFQAAKRGRELSKVSSLQQRHAVFLTAALCLARKGLMVIENNMNILQNRINLYNLDDFDEYCESKNGNQMFDNFLLDKKTFRNYFKHIEKIIDSSKHLKFDQNLLKKVKGESPDLRMVDDCVQKVIVNLFKFYQSGEIVDQSFVQGMSNPMIRAFEAGTSGAGRAGSGRDGVGAVKRQILVFLVYCDSSVRIDQVFKFEGQDGRVFDWGGHFRELEGKGDAELEAKLEDYKNRVDTLGKANFYSIWSDLIDFSSIFRIFSKF